MSDARRQRVVGAPAEPPAPEAAALGSGIAPTEPGAPTVDAPGSRTERSEPIRVISMKDQARPARSDEPRAPLHVQLRSAGRVARHDTPVGLGHLAPPRDPRQARARRLRDNLGWACVALVLAGAIGLAIWFVAG